MKTMLKILVALVLISVCSFSAFAVEKGEYFDSQLKASGAEELYSTFDNETKDTLSALGIDGVEFDSLFDISPQRVFSFIKKIIDGKLKEPVKAVTRVMGIILILSAGEAFMPDNEKMKSVLNTLGVLLISAALSVPIFEIVGSAVSSVGMCCTFMKTLIPILAGAVIASGNPALAVSFQSWAFAAAQLISSVCQSFVIPIVGAVIGIDISGALIPHYQLDGITKLIKKTVITVLSFTATLYVSFLGIKGALSSAADSVAVKGIKLIISSAVPVVGGALSEAYSGIIGSLTLVKSTLGVFGIISVVAITLPPVLQLLLWIFALKICSAAGEVFLQSQTSKLLESLSSALTLMNVVLLFNGVLFIISMALLLNLK
ncbi:MAG: stage III sporulation protein AE [Clostridia bacterium]|nr:stage III sporulation protein AE [Clostridia bacterium]